MAQKSKQTFLREWLAIFLTSLWLLVVLQYLIPIVLVLPLSFIPGVGVQMYRRIAGFYDTYFGRFACVAIPFSWCGTQIYINDFELLMNFKDKGNGLLLSNHGSRVDWLMAVYVGMVGDNQARVGFVAEVTTALMPVIGWSRYLMGDILLQRAFHKDRPRIMDNIKGYHDSGVNRVLFLAPEGTIADPGIDDQYVECCAEFMRKEGLAPMTHLLTPRYKGMGAFVLHSPKNVASCVMCFVGGGPRTRINDATGAVEGGTLYSTALKSATRVIPDLHTIFSGGLNVFCNIHGLELHSNADGSELDDAGAKKIRAQLIAEQVTKDGWMREFEATKKFSGIRKGSDWKPFPTSHLKMNGALLLSTMISVTCNAWLFSLPKAAVCAKYAWVVAAVFALQGSSYKIGQMVSDGRSRESLVGETAIKAFLNVVFGRHMNQGGSETASKQELKKTE